MLRELWRASEFPCPISTQTEYTVSVVMGMFRCLGGLVGK